MEVRNVVEEKDWEAKLDRLDDPWGDLLQRAEKENRIVWEESKLQGVSEAHPGGRPPRRSSASSRAVTTRLAQTEHDVLLACLGNGSQSDFIREAIVEKARRFAREHPELEELAHALDAYDREV